MTGRGHQSGAAPPFSPTSSERFRNLGNYGGADVESVDTDGAAYDYYRHHYDRGSSRLGEDEREVMARQQQLLHGQRALSGGGVPRPRLETLPAREEDTMRLRSVQHGSSAYWHPPPPTLSVHPSQYERDSPAHGGPFSRDSGPLYGQQQFYGAFPRVPASQEPPIAVLRSHSGSAYNRQEPPTSEFEHRRHDGRELSYSRQYHQQQQQQYEAPSRIFTGKRKAGEPADQSHEFDSHASFQPDAVRYAPGSAPSGTGRRPLAVHADSSYFAPHLAPQVAVPAQTRQRYPPLHAQEHRGDYQSDPHHLSRRFGEFRGSDIPALNPWAYRHDRHGNADAQAAATAAAAVSDRPPSGYQRTRSLSPKSSSTSSPPSLPSPPAHFRRTLASEQTTPPPPPQRPSTPPPALPSHGRVIANASRNISFAMLQPHFERPLQEAALHFGVCTTLLKKICRKNGIKNWPYRRICGLHKSIASMEKQVHYFDGEQKQSYAEQLRKLQLELDAYKRIGSAPTEAFTTEVEAEVGVRHGGPPTTEPPSGLQRSSLLITQRDNVAEAKSEGMEIETSYRDSRIDDAEWPTNATALSGVSTHVSISSYRYASAASSEPSYAEDDVAMRERSYYFEPHQELTGENRVMASTVDLDYDDDSELQHHSYGRDHRYSLPETQRQYTQHHQHREHQHQQVAHEHQQSPFEHQRQQLSAQRVLRERRGAARSSSTLANRPTSSSLLRRRTLPSISFMLYRGDRDANESAATLPPANQPSRHQHL